MFSLPSIESDYDAERQAAQEQKIIASMELALTGVAGPAPGRAAADMPAPDTAADTPAPDMPDEALAELTRRIHDAQDRNDRRLRDRLVRQRDGLAARLYGAGPVVGGGGRNV